MQGSIQLLEPRRRNMRRSPEAVARSPQRDALDLLEQFGSTVTIPRDRQIHGQGEPAEACYRVLSGCVRVVKLMEDGRRQIGEFLLPGDLFGFDALETHDAAAEAVTETILRRYPRRMVEMLAESHLALARRLRELTAASLRTTHVLLLLLGRKTACERIASFLLEMAERLPQGDGGMLGLPMSRTDMADHLGLTIETVCRVLAHLRREGIVFADRTGVRIRDRVALEQIACEPRH